VLISSKVEIRLFEWNIIAGQDASQYPPQAASLEAFSNRMLKEFYQGILYVLAVPAPEAFCKGACIASDQ
jgi:hypothetical protein